MEHFIETIGRNMFAIFGVMALGGAAVVVASRSAVHSVLAFLFAMLCIAGCFLSLEAEFLGAVVGDRRADEAARVHHHEIDGLRGDFLCGEHKVALVFPARIVGNNDHLARADVRQHFFNCVKLRVHRTRIDNAEWRGLPEKKTIEGGEDRL